MFPVLQMRRQNSLDLGRTASKRSRWDWKPGKATPLHAFLEKYGYFNEQVPKAATSTRFSNAIRAFQWVSQLPVSGVLDRTTLRQMTRPRCGVADTDSYEAWTERISDLFAGHQSQRRRKKRFAKQGNKWYKQHLSYRLVNWPERLPEPAVRGAVRAAFQLWSNVSALEFWEAPATGPADIRLTFFQGDHNDGLGNAFDGPGGALAHAFLPRRGEAHFDRDERWTLSRRRGRNLFVVLAHEIGHTLGLAHSPAPRALMAPYYKRLGRGALLSWDDVLAVQSLYGEPPAVPCSCSCLTPPPPGLLSFHTGSSPGTSHSPRRNLATLPRMRPSSKAPCPLSNLKHLGLLLPGVRGSYLSISPSQFLCTVANPAPCIPMTGFLSNSQPPQLPLTSCPRAQHPDQILGSTSSPPQTPEPSFLPQPAALPSRPLTMMLSSPAHTACPPLPGVGLRPGLLPQGGPVLLSWDLSQPRAVSLRVPWAEPGDLGSGHLPSPISRCSWAFSLCELKSITVEALLTSQSFFATGYECAF
nr:matrix metalloproteinase-28 isoform X2 [Saimiri boliviensis boliviensis]